MDRTKLVFSLGLATLALFALASHAVPTPPQQDPTVAKAPAVKFDSARAWTDLTTQVAFGPRKPGTEAHLKCREYIVEEMKKTCDNVRKQPFSHIWSRTNDRVNMWNVLGEQNWKDAKVRVLLIAHWDTRPSAEQDPNPDNRLKPIPGANDGASGVAVLLELARVLKGNLPPGVGVQYLMVDGEDLGPGLEEMFLGARYYAANLPAERPNYGILLDMIGDKDLQVPLEPQSLRYARPVVRALFKHAKTVGLESTFPSIEGPPIEDDHICINQAGIPTVDLIDFDYPDWHTLTDTPDKCSAESLGKVGKLLETFLRKSTPFKP